jgi:succinoglycan biosynthesis transport protein ExoP
MEPSLSHQHLPVPADLVSHPGYVRGYSTVPYRAEAEIPGEPESGGVLEYWRLLQRRRGTLVLITFLGLCAAMLITLPQTPVYRARAAVEIQSVNSDFLNSRQLNPVTEESSSANVLTDVQTQLKILGSEHLVDRVIDRLKAEGKLQPLIEDHDRWSAVRAALNLPKPQADEEDYRMRRKAFKNLTVRQVGQTRVIEVLYSSTDARFAADFVNTLASEYTESNMEARWKMSEHTGEWLSGQLNDMRTKLERSESALQDYARRSGLLFTTPASGNSEKTNVSEDKLRQLQEALSKAQADRAAAQSRYEIAQSAKPNALADVLNDESLRDLQEKLTDLHRQEAELISIYTAKHEKVRRVQAQIAPLEAAFNSERAAILERIRNDYETALRRERLLDADYVRQTHVVTDQADKSIQYNILKRDVDSSRQLYESMLQQVKAAGVASAIRASNVRIVDPAKTPHKPYTPDYLLNSALGLLAGLLAGIATIAIRERADRTLQEPGDTPFWTSLPELGIVPSNTIDKGRFLSKDPRALASTPPAREEGASESGRGVTRGKAKDAVELVSWQRKPSLMAEGFRTVLTSLLFAGENASRPRVLLLTSASPMEGKTTVVCNLGIAMAEIRQRVLLIDADLRKPRLHQLFRLANKEGLSTILAEPALELDTLDKLIQESGVPGLSALTSGPPTFDVANLLHSPLFRDILTYLKGKFDMILIDTPPSLQMADARIAGRLTDGVVLVVRAGRTTRDAAMAIHQRFAEDRIKILGTILNDWNPKQSPSGYYGYYSSASYGGYHYGYGSELKKTGT